VNDSSTSGRSAQIASLLSQALRHHQGGRLGDAEQAYRAAIALDNRCADAWHGLGLIAHQAGKYAHATELIRNAIALNAAVPAFYNNLAQALLELGLWDEAKAACNEALRLDPRYAQAWNSLGMIAREQRDIEQAIALYQKALRVNPDLATARNNLANALIELGKYDTAMHQLRTAIRLNPNFSAAHNNLGVAERRSGNLVAAMHRFREAIRLDNNNAEARSNLGSMLLEIERIDEAADLFRSATRIDPAIPEAWNGLGMACRHGGRIHEAIGAYERATALKPDYADAYNNLGDAHRQNGDVDRALASFLHALTLRPEFAAARSNYLFTVSHHVLLAPRDQLAAHQQWDHVHGTEGRSHRYPHRPQGDPAKRLRIGYVSPDLCRHAVSYFFAPLLGAHHRDQVEVTCYANVANPDEMTERLRASADHWVSCVGMTDAQLAKRIHDDGIDILVDLAGHTAGHRLGAFCYQPAPIQATYLGYCATTGLATMDYWLTDEVIHPPDTMEQAVEALVRLPRCWVCYAPPSEAPAVQPRPEGGGLTFGCFNDRTKVTAAVIGVWSELLRALPHSRMFLKARQYADEATVRWLIQQFGTHGIEESRLRIEPAGSMADYLAAYQEVDMALDPFPRTGGVTTADALWMGVPVITLAGQRFIERHGASLVTAVGHPEWVASSIEDYKEKVLALARNPEQRRQLRATQRDRMAASPLLDANDLATHIEAVFRRWWLRYLGKSV
jgi:predicted O-linked N-acetylglucosamine transferase (SPINDLY family)